MFEGGKETWRDEEHKPKADESDNGLYDRFVYLISRFPRLPPSGRIFPEFVTAPVTELRRTELVECVEVRSLSGVEVLLNLDMSVP